MHPGAIGPFKIERELGRGDMGEVFLARDTRLDRQVAIKALPVHLAQDQDRLARFQREAKVLASLNHPGIGAIYGLEEVNGHQYLILEYIEGETLADRLAKGPIPVDESLSLARQMTEALEVAHEKGVIHRDLKPGNVMVTPDGIVKVLDFGLARAAEGGHSSAAPVAADSPTVPMGSPTIPGAIMGTAGYMSPEQRPAAGSGEAVKMFAIPTSQQLYIAPSAWSPDGKMLAIVQTNFKLNTSDVLMLEQDAGGATWKATPYLNTPADEHALRFSPDGKWVVFCSVESGRHELYAQRFTGAASGEKDAASGRVQISTTGHDGAAWWSPDGKEIRYIDGDRQIVSVEVKTEPTFSASLPKVLYTIKEVKTRNFGWAPDGRLMVILQNAGEQANKIDLIVNFNEEVRAKMGAAK